MLLFVSIILLITSILLIFISSRLEDCQEALDIECQYNELLEKKIIELQWK